MDQELSSPDGDRGNRRQRAADLDLGDRPDSHAKCHNFIGRNAKLERVSNIAFPLIGRLRLNLSRNLRGFVFQFNLGTWSFGPSPEILLSASPGNP